MAKGKNWNANPENDGSPYTIEGIEIEVYHTKSGFSKKFRFTINGKWNETNHHAYSVPAITKADIDKFRRKPNTSTPGYTIPGQSLESAIGEFRVRVLNHGKLTASSVPIAKMKAMMK